VLLLAENALRADDTPRAVFTPDALSRYFAVRADVLSDAAGQPLIVPRASLGRGGAST
jgi:hypothetical protein